MKTHFYLSFLFLMISSSVLGQLPDFKSYEIVYSQSFKKDKCLADFEFSERSKWIISNRGKSGTALKCTGQGGYRDELGGPSVVAVLKGMEFSDFVMEFDVQQAGKDFNLLDFCIFFGAKSKKEYCYAQIANKTDRHIHNVFSANNAKPESLEPKYEKGVIWGYNEWHHVKVVRVTSAKIFRVYFDEELLFETKKEPFIEGKIGFGSTSSAFKVDNLKIRAPKYTTVSETIF